MDKLFVRNRISELRTKKRVSKYKMSLDLGHSKSYIQSISSGKAQPSFDKQFVRDYLESLDWNKQPPAPALPEDIVAKSRDLYLGALEKLLASA